MRLLLVCGLALGCTPAPQGPEPQFAPVTYPTPAVAAAQAFDPTQAGTVVSRTHDFVFDGGSIEIELRRDGHQVYEVAHNHFMVPVVMRWNVTGFDNLTPTGASSGVQLLPAASAPNESGPGVLLTTYQIDDSTRAWSRFNDFRARFGDPMARPTPYAYRLPYRAGKTFSVLQGFHGSFSHKNSNEYAVDFDCPVATPVLAARPGIVVAANGAAQGSGTTPEFLEYKRVNFVLVLHDDGTLGEYMHLAPSGVRVTVGQRVERGDELALSGNTGYSSTPHLHFQVMTAADDGVNARSFPFELAATSARTEEPVQGRAYPAWE